MAKRLRSGYTTGACAAAAAKAAALLLVNGEGVSRVDIPFPGNVRHSFSVHQSRIFADGALASIIKDAGDDPDVTNGAEIRAECYHRKPNQEPPAKGVLVDNLLLVAGSGVGCVTKPGLAAAVGEPAINPVPRQMIAAAVQEVMADKPVLIVISVVQGRELAEKTLNKRLGIIGGLSILGTTGIVRPISADAWTATIKASMDVAWEAGVREVVLSTGRTSERGAQSRLDLPEEAYVMMGDYLEFSLNEAAEHGFTKIHLAGMWAKITKAALKVPQTHVKNGALEMDDAARFLKSLGVEGDLLKQIDNSNTAREMYEHLYAENRQDIISAVCLKAKEYAQEVAGREIAVYLVSHKAQVMEWV